MFFLPLIHTPIDTKSKINNKHKKSTTKSTTKLTTRTKSLDWWSVIVDRGLERRFDRWCGSMLMEIGDGLMWISVEGDRWWVDGDWCWWRSVLMEIDVDGVLVMGWWRSMLMEISFVGWRRLVLMECLWWCFWVDGDQWIGEALWCLWWLWCWWSSCFGASGFWMWEKEEERRGRKERGNGKDKEKERRRKKMKYWKKKRVGKIILKKEYKNIIYI